MKSIQQVIKEATKDLTHKQAKFVAHYVSNGNNGTQAAISAMYSKKTARKIASENLSKPDIICAMEKVMSEIAERVGLTPELTLTTIKECMTQLDREKNASAVLKACELAGKHLKLFTDKTETEVTVKSHEDWLDELK